jgi:hypothetical protein
MATTGIRCSAIFDTSVRAAVGDRISPATRSCRATRRYSRSFCGSPSELHSTTEYPEDCAMSSTPRAIEVKNGFSMSGITRAQMAVSWRRRLRASAFGS